MQNSAGFCRYKNRHPKFGANKPKFCTDFVQTLDSNFATYFIYMTFALIKQSI
nr:MAG TPA: hypothetical protein [Caudoviricetes sp.]